MQALIDFDGWRKWKDFADTTEENEATSKLSVSYQSIAPSKKASTSQSPTVASSSETNGVRTKEEEKEAKRKRKSLSVIPQPVLKEEAETPPVENPNGSS